MIIKPHKIIWTPPKKKQKNKKNAGYNPPWIRFRFYSLFQTISPKECRPDLFFKDYKQVIMIYIHFEGFSTYIYWIYVYL